MCCLLSLNIPTLPPEAPAGPQSSTTDVPGQTTPPTGPEGQNDLDKNNASDHSKITYDGGVLKYTSATESSDIIHQEIHEHEDDAHKIGEC